MPRARNKADLLKSAAENFSKLMDLISKMTESQMNTPFNFPADASHKEAHWGRDRNVRDVLVHLYEWHQLMIKFVERNAKNTGKGLIFAFLPDEYSWKTYGAMNIEFWKRHQETTFSNAMLMLAESHRKVLSLIEQYTDDELFTKKHFPWTGTSDLGSYFVSTTASHYDWAIKKLKQHCKMTA